MPPSATQLARKSYQYLSKNYRYLVADPSFFAMKAMARFEVARDWMARGAEDASLARVPTGDTPNIACGRSFAEAAATLRGEGYFVGLSLRPSVVEALVRRAQESFCYADRDPAHPFMVSQQAELERALGRHLKVASYFNQQESWPEFQALLTDPWLLALSEAYLGRPPIYLRSEVAWSFPQRTWTRAERVAAAQVFHCDINDFRSLKYFFYLTDVDLDGGPHTYIKKSPRPRRLIHQLMGQRCASIPDNTLLDMYREHEVVTICGPAGTGFAGDPYYFHRGTAPTERPRLLLQIEVGCRRYRTWYKET